MNNVAILWQLSVVHLIHLLLSPCFKSVCFLADKKFTVVIVIPQKNSPQQDKYIALLLSSCNIILKIFF